MFVALLYLFTCTTVADNWKVVLCPFSYSEILAYEISTPTIMRVAIIINYINSEGKINSRQEVSFRITNTVTFVYTLLTENSLVEVSLFSQLTVTGQEGMISSCIRRGLG